MTRTLSIQHPGGGQESTKWLGGTLIQRAPSSRRELSSQNVKGQPGELRMAKGSSIFPKGMIA